MGYPVKQSTTTYPLIFLIVQSSDHITGLTGASPTVTISKNGAAFASPSGAVSEIGNGWYKVAGNATDSGTLGPLALHATAASGDPVDDMYFVVSYDPQDAVHLGLSALPNTACTSNASLITSGTGTDQLSVSSGIGQANVEQWDSVAIAEPSTDGIPDVNVLNWRNQAVPATSQTGVPLTDPHYWNGTAFVSTATAGIPDVNVKNWANVAPNALVQGKVDATDNVRNGTAQAGAGGTITLDAGASATDQFYRGLKVSIVSGTGANQGSRLIGGYVGATKVASVVPNWTTNPDSTSVFILSTWCGTDVELWELVTPNGLISGRLDVSAGAMAANVITASAINAGALNGKGDWLVSSSYPANFGSLAVTAGGAVTVGTNNDKTGYSLTQSFPANFSSLSIDTSGRVTLVPSQIVVKKNVALNNFEFLMVQSSDHVTGKTGLTFSSSTAQVSIDGAAFAGLTNAGAVTEIAFGIYKITLAAADLNGNVITLRFSGSGADDRFYLILTQP